MKQTTRFLLTALFLSPIFLKAQSHTWFGAEFGVRFDDYQHRETGEMLSTPPFFWAPALGLTIGHQFDKHWEVQSGFNIVDYGEGYRIDVPGAFIPTGGHSNALIYYQIPVRVRYHLPLIENRLNAFALAGPSINFSDEWNSSGSGGGMSSNGTDVTWASDTSNYSGGKLFGMFEAGFGLEFRTKFGLALNWTFSYHAGFSRVVDMQVSYQTNQEPVQTAEVWSGGNYIRSTLGLGFDIGKIWRGKGS